MRLYVDSVSLPAPELKFMLIFNVLQHLSSAQTGCLFFRELIANSNHVEFINQALSQIGFFKVINEKCLIHCTGWLSTAEFDHKPGYKPCDLL